MKSQENTCSAYVHFDDLSNIRALRALYTKYTKISMKFKVKIEGQNKALQVSPLIRTEDIILQITCTVIF